MQEKLGVMNKGTVYALWQYEAQGSDELSITEGDAITVLRRHDDAETDWWWARLDDGEGYIPRNLLGVSGGGAQRTPAPDAQTQPREEPRSRGDYGICSPL